jgi:hypothetical protein
MILEKGYREESIESDTFGINQLLRRKFPAAEVTILIYGVTNACSVKEAPK